MSRRFRSVTLATERRQTDRNVAAGLCITGPTGERNSFTMERCVAASISAAPRSRQSWSTTSTGCSAQARIPRPRTGGPQAVAEAIAAALARRPRPAGVEPSRAGRDRRRLAGRRSTTRPAPSPRRRNVTPDWTGSFPLAARDRRRLGGRAVRLGNDVTVGTEAEFAARRRREFESLLGVFWGTGVGSGMILDGQPWVGRGAAGEIGHMVVRLGGATLHLRAARLHRGLRRPPVDGAARPAAGRGRGSTPSCSRSWRSAGRDEPLQRGLGDGARAATTSWRTHLIDRAMGALAAGDRLGGQPARRRGGGDRRRARHPAGRALRGPDPRARCSRTCSSTTARRRCAWPRSATWAARSAPRFCVAARPRPAPAYAALGDRDASSR